MAGLRATAWRVCESSPPARTAITSGGVAGLVAVPERTQWWLSSARRTSVCVGGDSPPDPLVGVFGPAVQQPSRGEGVGRDRGGYPMVPISHGRSATSG